jgi:transposase
MEMDSHHGGMSQRWLLVYSEQAYTREKKTLERQLEKKEAVLKKEIWHLGNKEFGCEKDAEGEVRKLAKQYPLYHITCQVLPILKHEGKGKPAAGAEPRVKGYKVDLMAERNESAVEEILNRKGRFILATNDLDKLGFTSERMLAEYKGQQKVEGGFRFLKDPWFMVDSVFLKSAHRIESLMMVMTLCLLVYNVAQYKLRKRLVDTGETLPNQLGKEVQNSTLRWIFQIMEGMGMLHFYGGVENKMIREMVTNMSPLRRKIIQLFGPTACEMHGLNPESAF